MRRIEYARSSRQRQRSPEEGPQRRCHRGRSPNRSQAWPLSSGWSEPLRLDRASVMTEIDQEARYVFNEGSGATDINPWISVEGKARVGQHRLVDPSPIARPSLRLYSGKRTDHPQIRIAARHCIKFFSVNCVLQASR